MQKPSKSKRRAGALRLKWRAPSEAAALFDRRVAIARHSDTLTQPGKGCACPIKGDIVRPYASNMRSEEGLRRDFQAVMTAKHEGKI